MRGLKRGTFIELFAGAGGLALGLECAGLKCIMLNEIDKHACSTLRKNKPYWNVIESDIKKIDFTIYSDIIAGGFPCQPFSYAGKQLGFDDVRGTLFFEYAKAVKEVKPKICLIENVRGLLRHDGGKTISGMISVLNEIGYRVLPPTIHNTMYYRVPQKRERLIIIAIRKDIKEDFEFPLPYDKIYTIHDAFFKGELYDCDVPISVGKEYSKYKHDILKLVPPGGNWRDLPLELQKEYMGKNFYIREGGQSNFARRMSWDKPCLTLMCSPAEKMTERCHPGETRPFTIREYARLQTFPDNWEFEGSISAKYKQIGNAVPVNFAIALGCSLKKYLNLANK